MLLNIGTRFFHHTANSHRRTNTVGRLDGEVYADPNEIGSQIVEFYHNLFSEVRVRRLLLDALFFPSLDVGDASGLDGCFTEEVVLETIKSMNG